VAGAVVAGFLDAVGVVPGPFDDAGVAPLPPGVEVLRRGDAGGELGADAFPLVRGKKPGR
jgi:hypothetical protein